MENQNDSETQHDSITESETAPHIRQRLYWVAVAELSERGQGAIGRGDHLAAAPGWIESASGAGERGTARLLPVTTSAGLEERGRIGSDGGEEYATAERAGDAGELGNATSHDQRRPSVAGFDGKGIEAGGSSGVGIVEHPEGHRRQQRRAESGGRGIECGRGPVNGFWRECDWIPCTDGKARPVEPGTLPLAHGAPARILRLRGFGDGIVATQAAEFIRAVCEEIESR